MKLEIKDLWASIDGEMILKGVNLTVPAGEFHAIMGPNGNGKSTLVKVIAGAPEYTVERGEVLYDGENVLEMEPDERARKGLYLAFQYPVEIPGVTVANFLRLAIQARTGEEASAKNPLNFTVNAEGKVFWNAEELSWEKLGERLKAMPNVAEETAMISADQATPHGVVIKLMDALRSSGLVRFALNVEGTK